MAGDTWLFPEGGQSRWGAAMNITFGVPSGIGDVSWIYSKLIHIGPAAWEVADGWPHRTLPYLLNLPYVVGGEYGSFTYRDIIAFEESTGLGMSPTWEKCRKYAQEGRLLIEANRHLESGRRLEDWLPDLPTEFNYIIPTSDVDKTFGDELLKGLTRPLIGISAASYRGSEAWKTWGVNEWKQTLSWLRSYIPGCSIILLGGFWDDLTFTLAQFGYHDLVGKTSVSTMVYILDCLDLYIGFSSGMGVIRSVQNKSVFMMWPDHQVELSTSWAPLEQLANRKYIATQWRDPSVIIPILQNWIKLNLEH